LSHAITRGMYCRVESTLRRMKRLDYQSVCVKDEILVKDRLRLAKPGKSLAFFLTHMKTTSTKQKEIDSSTKIDYNYR